jgi:hypothetical protein
MLRPLQRLAAAGVAVLILHHPRKDAKEDGNSARGGGALLGFVDIILEVHRFGRQHAIDRRRKLIGLSRHTETPSRLIYEYNPANGTFALTDDPNQGQFLDALDQVRLALTGRSSALTHRELLTDWPKNRAKPSLSALYEWLNRATAERMICREGKGTRGDPYRYRLVCGDVD